MCSEKPCSILCIGECTNTKVHNVATSLDVASFAPVVHEAVELHLAFAQEDGSMDFCFSTLRNETISARHSREGSAWQSPQTWAVQTHPANAECFERVLPAGEHVDRRIGATAILRRPRAIDARSAVQQCHRWLRHLLFRLRLCHPWWLLRWWWRRWCAIDPI